MHILYNDQLKVIIIDKQINKLNKFFGDIYFIRFNVK